MNTPKSNVMLGQEAIRRRMDGMKVAVDAIRMSYGPNGTNAIIECDLYPYHRVANDAQTIVQAMWVEGSEEKIGLDTVKELMDKADKSSRDGRKTTAIISDEILNQGYKAGETGVNYNVLKRELDALIPVIEKEIDLQKKEITVEDVHKVASVAAESKDIGDIIGKIYQEIGKDGIIHIEGSGTFTTSYTTLTDGVRFSDTGYLSPYMVHDPEAKKAGRTEEVAIYKNPTILVTKAKIANLNDINPLLKMLENEGKKDLIIFTDDMDSAVARILVDAHRNGVFNICIVKAPVLWKGFVFEDFARVTGSTIVEDSSGINFKSLKVSHLGTCGKIVIDKDEITVSGIKDISAHIDNLKKIGDNDSLIRLTYLQTKTATLKLGANSESELSHLMLKAEDGKNSARLALADGVVPGGGWALSMAAGVMPDTVAGRIMKEALEAPAKQLLKNASATDLSFSADIVDAAKVVKNAVRNAVGLASTILTTGVSIALPPKSAEQVAAEVLKGKGLRF